jgi:uncharacterized membrane protein YphA (DoxX/SURF4 family)
MNILTIQKTDSNKLAGGLRIFLGVVFVMAGLMKLLVPMLAEAWSGQLLAAGLPFYTLTRWSVPFVEAGIGVALLIGFHARLASVVVMGIMVVATYVHITVDDPSLFPMQPSEPIVPVLVMAIAGYLIWAGAGAWSVDLRASRD